DKAYDDLRSSLGADGNTCYMPCCTIQFRMEIKVRKATDPASEGFHQIEIMPDYRTEMKDGVEVKVRNRSFILKTANPDPAIAAGSGPDNWVLNGQKASTTGEWAGGHREPRREPRDRPPDGPRRQVHRDRRPRPRPRPRCDEHQRRLSLRERHRGDPQDRRLQVRLLPRPGADRRLHAGPQPAGGGRPGRRQGLQPGAVAGGPRPVEEQAP